MLPIAKVKVEYDSSKILQGMQQLSNTKKSKCYVSLDKQVQRDDLIYNFDKDDVKQLTRRMKKKELRFDDAIPNNMEPRRSRSRLEPIAQKTAVPANQQQSVIPFDDYGASSLLCICPCRPARTRTYAGGQQPQMNTISVSQLKDSGAPASMFTSSAMDLVNSQYVSPPRHAPC